MTKRGDNLAEKSTKKKTTSAKRGVSAAKQEEQASSHKQLFAILFLAFGVFFIALTLVSGENFWAELHGFLFGMFGWCAYLIGPLFLYLAIMNTLERPSFSSSAKVWEVLGLIVLICAATTIFIKDGVPEDGFFNIVKTLFSNGKELRGGGFFSVILGVPLYLFLGETGAKITVSILIFVMLMLITGTTLAGLARGTKEAGKKVRDVYTEQVEHARMQPDPGAVIDIPLDDPLPQHPVRSPKRYGADPVQDAKGKLLGTAAGSAAAGTFAGSRDRVIDIPLDGDIPTRTSPASAGAAAPTAATYTFAKATAAPSPLRNERAVVTNGFKIVTPEQLVAEKEAEVLRNAAASGIPAEISTSEGVRTSEDLEQLILRAAQQDENKKKDEKHALEKAQREFSVDMTEDLETRVYRFPPVDMLKPAAHTDSGDITLELKQNADLLVDTLNSFGVQTRVINISRGPAVTRYELQPSAGVKISKITNLADDIALNLASAGVRIEAPIPNKAAVGIEVPNKNIAVVSIREIIDSGEFQSAKGKLSVALGKDITGRIMMADLAKMPHLLIAGATGSGKSVCINSMIVSLLYKATPGEVRLLMIDPKVVELGVYNGIPHLLVPVVTDPRKAAGALNWAVSEMLGRYKLFADNGVRDLTGFNKLAETREDLQPMPQIVIIIDELADLMMVAPNEVEDAVCRLAQMARAAGMHLVIATQRPSVDVITGIIKANIPSRIAFAVSSYVDSRTILDGGGAEKLLGRGDMLFSPVGSPKPQRIQGCFVSDNEVEDVVAFIKGDEPAAYDERIQEEIEKNAAVEKGKRSVDGSDEDSDGSDDDEMLPAAIECVVEMGQASTSLLQRKLKLGYARAARIIDQMEERGIVGPFEGSKPRQVLISREQWMEMNLRQ